LLLAALEAEPIVLVRAVLEAHLGRVASRSELTACRRAAHHLAATGRARVARLPAGSGYERTGGYLVLTRPDADVDDEGLRRAAHRAANPPAGSSAGEEPSVADATALATALVEAVGEAAAPLPQAQAYLVPPAVAGQLAAELADVGAEVARLRRQLERRAAQEPVQG
jgi:hypothetical protein